MTSAQMMVRFTPRRAVTVASVAAVYFAAAKLGLRLAFFHPSATAVWPSSGIALSSLLLIGYGTWPGILVGAFLANLTTAGTVWTSLGIAIGNMLEGLVGAYLVNRCARGSDVFDRAQDVFKFVLLAAVLSTMIAATVGPTSLALGGFARWADYGQIWLTWWLGDATGVLIAAPLIILWARHPRVRLSASAALERALFLLGLLAVSAVVFGGVFPFAYLTTAFLVWAAFRFDRRETATVIALLATLAVWGTVKGRGPFIGATPNDSLLQLQAFMGVTALLALPLVSVIAERDATGRETTRRTEAGFRLMFAGNPLPMWIFDPETLRFLEVNDAAVALYGYSSEEFLKMRISDIRPPDEVDRLHRYMNKTRPRLRSAGEWQHRTKDGRLIDVEISSHDFQLAERPAVLVVARDVSERKRAEEALRTRASMMGRLLALGPALNRRLTVAQTVEVIGRAALGLSGADRAAVYLYEGDGTVTCRWSHALSSGYAPKMIRWLEELSRGRALPATDPRSLVLPWGQHMDETQPMLVSDIHALPPESPLVRLAREEGYRALGAWPLVYEGQVIGVAGCYYDTPRTWADAEQDVFHTFSQKAAVALQNAYLHDASAQRMAELENLYHLSKSLRVAQTPEQIYRNLLDSAMALLGAQHGAVNLLDGERRTFTRVSTHGAPGEEAGSTFPVEDSHSGEVVRTGEPFVVADFHLHASAWLDRAPYQRLGPMAIVPLRAEDEVVGTLTLARLRPPHGQPFAEGEVRLVEGIANMGGTAIQRSRLHQNLEEAYLQMVVALATAVESRDTYTADHSERIARWAEAVATKLNCSEAEIKDIRRAAWLHDIGKIGIPDRILRKPMPLTKTEWTVMRRHPVIGEEILSAVDRMRGVAKLVRHHQERWDGAGYPDRLTGEQIPLGARILAVVDAYSAMIDARPYKGARTHEEATGELRRCAGSQFDPRVVEVFLGLGFDALRHTAKDSPIMQNLDANDVPRGKSAPPGQVRTGS
ncbi:MAG TPA: MASE1 domain-containing protein [bacterium]|nr:MASE1 domain-containing protein [bacterium]